ncbi:hypothetical protein OG530_41000 (plasmid) [Streptomyces decoyicus]|uniref:hypothetical protein n=1 Tax=Streptomyces decoyicus TaxID=249567 RepID=UPI002E190B7E
MAETDTQAADDAPLCEHCKRRPVPPSRGTKPTMYCGRNCRQRAYEKRQAEKITEHTVTMALLRERMMRAKETPAKSRDDAATPPTKSRDDAENPAAKSRDDAQDQQERPDGKSRDVPPRAPEQRPRRVTDYLAGAPKMGGW